MKAVKRLDGMTDYHILDFKISATVVENQPVIASATGTDGGELTNPTTTSLLDMVGLCIGASSSNPDGGGAGSLTYSTVQAATEGLIRVIVNPDLVIAARMSGGAAGGTALTIVTNTTANAAGTTVTDTTQPAASMQNGIAWGRTGANVGLSRKITTYTGQTSFVVTVPFPRTIAVNDTFLVAPWLPLTGRNIQLTTDFTEANAAIAQGTGGNATIVQVIPRDTTDSYVYFIARDHVFNELS
jgi:hypothetical protein